jgi:2-polyprenyl-3-methyl-5-hydroxy-6-metoxy-1,4-benzoquinol methylase
LSARQFLSRVKRKLVPNRYYADKQRYWEQRYEQLGSALESSGRRHMSEADNEANYETKWAHLLPVLERLEAGDRLCDAGCGVGWFTERFVARGLRVTAVDFTETGLAAARERVGGDVEWVCSDLAAYRSDQPFDMVACIDVLFHVVDDGEWEEVVRNLGALAAGGLLVIQDHLVEVATPPPSGPAGTFHTRWRTLGDYQRVLAGSELDLHDHYDLPMEETTKDLMVFRVPAA